MLTPYSKPFSVMHPNPFITFYSYAPSAPCTYCYKDSNSLIRFAVHEINDRLVVHVPTLQKQN